MARLDGKVAVVTGASSGIGEATAEALAAEGASVVVAARRKDRLEDLVGRIEEGNGGRVLSVASDVSEEQQAHDLIKQATDEFGRVDILVNSAGVMQPSKIEKGHSDEWRQMFDVNVVGLLYVTDAAIEAMKGQGSGHIVNISSVAGRKSRPFRGIYAGTKFAVNAISEALRQELLEDNIRVTMVEPGMVETEIAGEITDEEAQEAMSAMQNIETLQPEDIANAVVYVVTQPQRVSVNEILIRPSQQEN